MFTKFGDKFVVALENFQLYTLSVPTSSSTTGSQLDPYQGCSPRPAKSRPCPASTCEIDKTGGAKQGKTDCRCRLFLLFVIKIYWLPIAQPNRGGQAGWDKIPTFAEFFLRASLIKVSFVPKNSRI